MKIIDLLNKIAKGEEVPEEIKYYGFIWKLNKNEVEYYNDCDTPLFNQYLDTSIIDSLNDEVEIIEEQEEIDIQEIEKFEIDKNDFIQTNLGAFKTRKMDIAFLSKINELVQAVKQLDNKLKGE